MEETAIRRWKKLSAWAEYEQKIKTERAEVFKAMVANGKKDEYLQELEKQRKDLKALQEGMKAIAGHSTNLTRKAYIELSQQPDAVKACGKGTKAGVHQHSRTAMEAIKTVAQLNEQIYQISVVFDHLQDMEEEGKASSTPE